MDKIKRIKDLVKECNHHCRLYYSTDKTEISDKEYDKLFDELKKLETETGLILSNSPTQKVGYTIESKLKKVKHSIPLLSLDKIKNNIDELIDFIGDKSVILLHKLDGLTCELIYENGELIQASTRGTGEEGEDITHNAKTFKNLPLKIDYKGYLKVVGEAYIYYNDFDEINSKITNEEDKYKNPRNLVAGSVRQLDSKICGERMVYFKAFSLLESEKYNEFSMKSYQLMFLEGLGFDVAENICCNNYIERDRDVISNYIEKLKSSANEKQIPIDGVVCAYDDIKYGESLGKTSHHFNHSIAYKFDDEEVETTLTDIEWSIGRTGQLTPVAIFETVEIDGTDVNRASLHNISIMEGLQLGIGDKITVIKSNQIIPQVKENLTKSNTFEIPKHCPVCGGDTIITQENDSKVLYCTNPNCSGVKVKKFSHAVSKHALNIDGLSESTLQKFIDKGFLKDLRDLYNLNNYKNEIIKMEGFGKKSYDNLAYSLEKSVQDCTLDRLIYALGIDNVGRTASKTIAEYFKYDNNEFFNSVGCGEFDFTVMKDMGTITSDSINEYFQGKGKYDYMSLSEELPCRKQIEKVVITNNNNKLSGKTVYPTGTFAIKKDELKAKIEGLGAIISSGYSKKLDYLIVGGDFSKSGKVDKAKKDGIQLMSEVELMELLK